MKVSFHDSVPIHQFVPADIEPSSRSVGLGSAMAKLDTAQVAQFEQIPGLASVAFRNQVVADLVIAAVDLIVHYPPEYLRAVKIEWEKDIRELMVYFHISVHIFSWKLQDTTNADGGVTRTLVTTRSRSQDAVARAPGAAPAVKRRMSFSTR